MESVLDVGGIAAARDHARLPPRRPPRNKGEQDPADPPTVEEIVAVSVTALTATATAR